MLNSCISGIKSWLICFLLIALVGVGFGLCHLTERKKSLFENIDGNISSAGFTSPDNLPFQGIDTVVFLHTNDRHFDLNLSEEMFGEVSKIRSRYRNVFLLDAGDLFVRHPNRWIVNGNPKPDYEWYAQRALDMIASMNELEYDAMTLGNHELAYIEPHTRLALEAARFPILSANMDISTEHLPPVKDYVILQTESGIKIAILGLSVDNARFFGIRQKDIFNSAQEYMFLRDSSHVFVALTHIGLANDQRLAASFPKLDIIIGGHSHDLLKEAVMTGNVLLAHAGGNPHVVSDTHPVHLGMIFVILENGVIKKKWGSVVDLSLRGE